MYKYTHITKRERGRQSVQARERESARIHLLTRKWISVRKSEQKLAPAKSQLAKAAVDREWAEEKSWKYSRTVYEQYKYYDELCYRYYYHTWFGVDMSLDLYNSRSRGKNRLLAASFFLYLSDDAGEAVWGDHRGGWVPARVWSVGRFIDEFSWIF